MNHHDEANRKAETPESRDARLILGASKALVRMLFALAGVLGAIIAPTVAYMSTPEQIERISLWISVPAGLCIIAYFYFEIRWWWMREYGTSSIKDNPIRSEK
jgi:uncharacterized membrane protein